MVQQASDPLSSSPTLSNGVLLSSSQSTARDLTEFSADWAADRQGGAWQAQVFRHVIREVVVLEVTGRPRDAVAELDWAIQLALADAPRGVVCDLSEVLEGAEPGPMAMLATAGRHARSGSGIPVAVACADPLVREALAARPIGGYLIVTASLFSAVCEVLARPAP